MERSTEADVMGVVWDDNRVPQGGHTLQNLTNVTRELEIDNPRNPDDQSGYFIELQDEEKVLRRPLVFEGTAFFQTYQPRLASSACDEALAESFTYAFDNCTAAPVAPVENPSVEDREIYQNDDSYIGSAPTVIIRSLRDPPLIMGGDSIVGADGANLRALLQDNRQGRATKIYMWRLSVD